MDPPPAPVTEAASDVAQVDGPTLTRRDSSSQHSEGSQTAAEYVSRVEKFKRTIWTDVSSVSFAIKCSLKLMRAKHFHM